MPMIKVKFTTVYTFDELSEDAKAKAVGDYEESAMLYDWWEYVYEDAKNIGLEITGFDLYRHDIDGKLIEGANQVMRNIIANHGEDCETFKTVLGMYSSKHDKEADCLNLDDSLLEALLEDYLTMLRSEYEYLTSEENVRESSEANSWQYTEDGKLY